LSSFSLPDGVILKACGSRSEVRCPSCAAIQIVSRELDRKARTVSKVLSNQLRDCQHYPQSAGRQRPPGRTGAPCNRLPVTFGERGVG
jgi:hypothetical protein